MGLDWFWSCRAASTPGSGTFQTPVSYAVGQAPTALIVGDFTNDGRLDLATADNISNTVTVLLGQGNGTFQAQTPVVVGSYPLALVAGGSGTGCCPPAG